MNCEIMAETSTPVADLMVESVDVIESQVAYSSCRFSSQPSPSTMSSSKQVGESVDIEVQSWLRLRFSLQLLVFSNGMLVVATSPKSPPGKRGQEIHLGRVMSELCHPAPSAATTPVRSGFCWGLVTLDDPIPSAPWAFSPRDRRLPSLETAWLAANPAETCTILCPAKFSRLLSLKGLL